MSPRVPGEEQPLTDPASTLRLWYGVLAGAAAWKLQLVVNYALNPYACWHRAEVLGHLASFIAAALAATGVWVAWGIWKRAGKGMETEHGGTVVRARWMALTGIALSAYFVLLILGQWLPNLLLSPCDGIS